MAVRALLTDLNPAYKTLATGPSGQRAVYEGRADTHTWTLIGTLLLPETGRGRSALVPIAAVTGVVLLAAAAGVVVTRRRRAASLARF